MPNPRRQRLSPRSASSSPALRGGKSPSIAGRSVQAAHRSARALGRRFKDYAVVKNKLNKRARRTMTGSGHRRAAA